MFTDIRLSPLAHRLIKAKCLTEELAKTAQLEARKQQVNLIDYLLTHQLADNEQLAKLIAQEFDLPYLDLATIKLEDLPQQLINNQLLIKHCVYPLKLKNNQLNLAISRPTNLTAIDEIKFHTGYLINPVIVAENKLQQLINQATDNTALQTDSLETLDFADADEASLNNQLSSEFQEDAPLVTFVNQVLTKAINKGASDIHFEPYETHYRIRSRIDGILYELANPPLAIRHRLAARLKVMAKLNIAEKRLPQDGSIKFKVSPTKSLDFRVNTLPTLWGEKLVLRILDASNTQLGIDQLGFEPEQQQLYEEVLHNPQGMILVTGPTGSGKTVSLYSGLHLINTPERNISSAEDPVEIHIEGINQVTINPKIGLDFATALRAFLRQDPDVVMLGEIRDLETAEIAIKAAQTGHLVLSTLHTNSAAATLDRLMNMGIPAYNLASSLQLVIAQRLARKLCSKCKQLDNTPKQVLIQLGFTPEELAHQEAQIYKAKGCNDCTSGYKGRVGIYELVKITPLLAEEILQGSGESKIAATAAQEGFYNLRTAGRKKVLAGEIGLAELNRVISR